jgi:hypothetical protein
MSMENQRDCLQLPAEGSLLQVKEGSSSESEIFVENQTASKDRSSSFGSEKNSNTENEKQKRTHASSSANLDNLDSRKGQHLKLGASPGIENASNFGSVQVHQAKWDEIFGRLLKYKKEHGDCLVPNRYEQDPSLGAWVSTQRR